MKIRRLLVLAMALTLTFSSFYAYGAHQELAIANAQGYAQYGNSEGAYKTINAYPQYFNKDVLEKELFVYGFMLDYIDQFKADGILPADYQYGGSTPAPAPAQPSAPVHEHTYKEEVTKESTCVEAGKVTKTCDCGYVTTENLPLGEHTYFENVTKEVSCMEDGEVSYLCSVCGDTYTETKAATGHTTGAMETITEATCTTDGEKGIKCSICGEYIDKTIVPATGHTEGDWEVTKNASLIANGEQVKKCVDCEEVLLTEVIPYNQTALIGVITAVVVVIGIIGCVIHKNIKASRNNKKIDIK